LTGGQGRGLTVRGARGCLFRLSILRMTRVLTHLALAHFRYRALRSRMCAAGLAIKTIGGRLYVFSFRYKMYSIGV